LDTRMKTLLRLLCLMPALVSAQAFNLFQPATGILKGSASTYVTTAAASSDVISLWTGTCNATTFLRADGSCQAGNAGTVTSVALTAPTGFTVTGSPITTSGTLAITTALSGILNGTGSGIAAATQANGVTLFTPSADANSIGIGTGSLTQAGITGTNNTGVGTGTLPALQGGSNNTAIGYHALNAEVTQGSNVAVGANAGLIANGGGGNTFLGMSAGSVATNGNNNIVVTVSNTGGLTSGSTNVLIGQANAITTGSTNIEISAGNVHSHITNTASNQLDIQDAIYASNTTTGPISLLGGSVSVGTKFTASGCTNSATVGGATAGQFASGTTGTCTVTITMGGASGSTAPNGWACHASDITTPANLIAQTSPVSATQCTITGTTVSGDTIVFSAEGY
jgi:hypothetical protein